MRVYITGIVGFIGFHLARRLKRLGFAVQGCDNFSSYYSVDLKRARGAILEEEKITVYHIDITNFTDLQTHFQENSYSFLIHLAAQAGVRYSMQNPDSYIQANLIGFYHILEIAKEYPSMQLIYASSSSVYGNNKKIPFSESDPTDSPTSLYGATKKSNEILAYSYHHLHKIKITGLRFFTVYGPWGRPDMAYYSFTKAILEGTPIELYDFGEASRDFTYIDDIVSGIVQAMKIEGRAEVFNLGNQRPQSIKKVVEILERLLGKKAIVQMTSLAVGDVPITYADGTLARKQLSFSSAISLEEGLQRFVSWYLSYYKERKALGRYSIISDAIKE